jgi:hypothetical protein
MPGSPNAHVGDQHSIAARSEIICPVSVVVAGITDGGA